MKEFSNHLQCIEKFVLFYEWKNGSGVLCPSFNVTKINETTFQCLANFTENICNETVHISFETWTKNKILLKNGPYGQVFINCSLNEPQTTGLSVAIYSILKGAASILIKDDPNGCTWTEWTEWTLCSSTCGSSPGFQNRFRHQIGSDLCQDKEEEEKICIVNKCPMVNHLNSANSWILLKNYIFHALF